MSGKRWCGLVALILGITIFFVSIYAKGRINEAKGNINQGTSLLPSLLPGNIIGKTLDKTIQQHIRKYEIAVSWGLGIGIVLAVAGTGYLIFYRKK